MNSKFIGILGAASVAAFALTPVPAAAMSDNSALVQKGVGCNAFFPALVGAILFTEDSIDVSNKGGNTQLTCHFDIPFGFEPEKAVKASGFNCRVITKDGFAVTTDSRFSATPGGRAHLSCKVKKD